MSEALVRSQMPIEILVVDDEPDLQLLIRQKFRKRIRAGEWVFHFAHNGFEALDKLAEQPDVSLVLTDINMPGMDGLTLLDRLANLDNTFKSIVISAYGDMSNIRTAMNRGAFDFVTKPVDFEDLEITIDKTLREVTAFREALSSQKTLYAIQKELAVAARIQEAFIPAKTLETDQISIHAFLEPANEVGGDFFDFFQLDDHRIGIVIGDVSGKGVSAALFMAITKTLLKAIAMDGRDPKACMTYVNALLYPQSLAEVFVTSCYGILDTRTGAFEYTTTGHFPPFVIRQNDTIELLDPIRSVGLCMTKDFQYDSKSTTLQPGDSIFMYTDGLNEAARADGQLFTDEGVESTLRETIQQDNLFSAKERVAHIVAAVKEFTKGAPQSDDLTLLMLHYKPQ
ncbi:MAG: PP2C family protein-serine/threonine phosphatase [Rhodothermales bacterium]